jgi:soluble lytic murein transglycosylase-like protein
MGMVMFVAALMLASTASVAADSVLRWRPYTDEAAMRCGMPVAWIERVMRVESAGLTTRGGHPITSRAGAMGLMQVMPATWADMRARLALGRDPYDPRDNILAGSCYLRLMYDRFGYPGLFAAYNAGPGRYADHLSTGRPLPGETRAYLTALAGGEATQTSPGDPASTAIFFVLKAQSMATMPPAKASTSGLFVTLGQELR